MNPKNDVNEQYSALCADILEPTLRKVALSFCVSPNMFYDTVHELTFPATRLMSGQAVALGVELNDEDRMGYDRNLETEKSQHRLYRIAKRLMVDQSENIPDNAHVLFAPKIYDKKVYDAMVSTYGSVAELIGDTLFNKLDKSYTIRALQIEERLKLSFSEFTMFVCLYMSVNRSAVKVLNMPLEEVNLKRLKGRMRSIKKWLFSQELHDAIFRTLTDLLAEENEEKYARMVDKHYREFWLPEDKRSLRNLNYALKKYNISVPNVTWSLFAAMLCDGITIETATQYIHDFNVESDQLRLYQDFFYYVLPIAELISQGIIPKDLHQTSKDLSGELYIDLKPYILDSHKVDRLMMEHVKRSNIDAYVVSKTIYQLAEKVCGVLDTYINATIVSAITFLECLPEAAIAGEHTLQEYFNMI